MEVSGKSVDLDSHLWRDEISILNQDLEDAKIRPDPR